MKHRCKNCNKLLAVGTGDFEIKCPRCKTVGRFRFLTTENAAERLNRVPRVPFTPIYKESK